jgi:hypothetical protein
MHLRHQTGPARLAAAAAALAVSASAALAQPEYDFALVDAFVPNYGLRETYLWDINDQGIAIGTTVGNTQIGISYVGFTWDQATGNTQRELSWPRGISNTGLAVGVGTVLNLGTGQSWSLPLLPATYIVPYPQDINDSGIAVGYVQTCNCSNSQGMLQIPYVWDASGGPRTASVPGATGLRRVNAQGVAIGWIGGNSQTDSFFVDLATGQYTLLSTVVPYTGPGSVKALDINNAGVIVGTRAGAGMVYHYGYIYTPGQGAQLLPLPTEPYQQAFTPTTINNQGMIAGQLFILGSPRSCIYDAQHGLRDLNDPGLVAGIQPGFTLMYTSRINDSGWIVGYGSGGGGMYKSFVLRPRAGAACYANCDGSTVQPVLNVLDFSCFLNRFAAGDPSANCDGSTTAPVLNVLDFSCFLNKFAAGCP